MSNLDFLDGPLPADAAPAQVEQVDQTAAPEAVVAEAVIAPVEGEVAAAAPVETVAPTPTPAEPGHVPISALLDEREKRQASDRALADFKSQAATQAAPQIDPYDDLPGFTQQVALNVKFDLSEDMAREKHGDPVVDAARDWAQTKMAQSPAFAHEVMTNRNPYGYVVSQYQRDQMVSQIEPGTFEAFKAWQAANAAVAGQTALGAAPAVATPAQLAVAAPPQSLASATSAGGVQAIPTGPGQAFDSVIK